MRLSMTSKRLQMKRGNKATTKLITWDHSNEDDKVVVGTTATKTCSWTTKKLFSMQMNICSRELTRDMN